MSLDYIIYLANYSDGVLYVLAGLLVVALAVIIDRFWSLRSTIIRGKSIVHATAARAALRCRLGAALYPLEVCAEQFEVAGLLSMVLAGQDPAEAEP